MIKMRKAYKEFLEMDLMEKSIFIFTISACIPMVALALATIKLLLE